MYFLQALTKYGINKNLIFNARIFQPSTNMHKELTTYYVTIHVHVLIIRILLTRYQTIHYPLFLRILFFSKLVLQKKIIG